MNDATERWRPVVGYEGLYEVSDRGRVRRVSRLVRRNDNRTYRLPGRVLAQTPGQQGYLFVTLRRGGKGAPRRVHRLVGKAFLGPIPDGMETRHGPAGKLDNSVANLSYGTRPQNAADKYRDGTQIMGSAIPVAKLTEDIVRECRARRAAGGVTWQALADEFGVSRRAMFFAVSGRTWKHVTP